MNIYKYICINKRISIPLDYIVYIRYYTMLYSILCYCIFNVHFFEYYMAFNYIILYTTLCLICAVDCSHSQITLYFAIFNFKLYYIMLYDIIYILYIYHYILPYFIIWDCIVVQCCVVYIVKCISYLLIGPTQNTSQHRRLLFGRSRAGAVGQKLVGGVLAANLGVVRCGDIFWAENTFLVWLSISIPPYSKYVYHYIPSGKHTINSWENHHAM
jgi:hypothetical protein